MTEQVYKAITYICLTLILISISYLSASMGGDKTFSEFWFIIVSVASFFGAVGSALGATYYFEESF